MHKCGNLAKDFQFSAPFVGPLPPESFAKTMKTLSLDDVFPDMSPRVYHMRVDPLQPNRVWFTTRCVCVCGPNTGLHHQAVAGPQSSSTPPMSTCASGLSLPCATHPPH